MDHPSNIFFIFFIIKKKYKTNLYDMSVKNTQLLLPDIPPKNKTCNAIGEKEIILY